MILVGYMELIAVYVMNKEEFKDIFDTYLDPIRSYVFYKTSDEELSQDIAQDVFMQVWRKRDRVDHSNIKLLLYKIASDLVVSHYRKKRVRVNFAKNVVMEHADDRSPMANLEYKELSKKYAEVLAMMSEQQREVFLMSREEALKYGEIAQRLNLSVKAIEKRMSSALKVLKDNLLLLLLWIVIN